MARCEISFMDTELFQKAIKLFGRMVSDKNVSPAYKLEIQAIIEDKNSMTLKRHPKVFYLCDRRACEHGCNRSMEHNCDVTSDIGHARNFALNCNGSFVEEE